MRGFWTPQNHKHIYFHWCPKGAYVKRFGDIHGPKTYKFIGSGDIHGPKAYEFVGFGDIHGLTIGTSA